jgi:hypothetical protein
MRLAEAALDALAAYRAIFGRSYWNGRDRAAFAALEEAIEAWTVAHRVEPLPLYFWLGADWPGADEGGEAT